MKRKNIDPWKVDLDQLTPNQLAKYEDSLEVLSLLRHGSTMRKASQMLRISMPTVKKYVSPALRTKNNRVTARKNDNLLRKMVIYEDGRQVFIQIKGRKKSTIIGQYLSAVGRRLDRNETNALESFRNRTIRDIKGKIHTFETDPAKLQKIQEAIEEPEFFQIYSR